MKENTEYIIETRDAAYILRDKAYNFGTVPQNAGRVVTLCMTAVSEYELAVLNIFIFNMLIFQYV